MEQGAKHQTANHRFPSTNEKYDRFGLIFSPLREASACCAVEFPRLVFMSSKRGFEVHTSTRMLPPLMGCNRSDAVFGIPLQGSCDYNLTTAMLEP